MLLFAIIGINRRHLEAATNIYIPGSIVIEFIQSLELRIKNILIRNGILNDLSTQSERRTEFRRELIGIRQIESMIQTMGFICFLDKSFIVLSLECIAGNEGIFPQFPCFLYIRDIAG